MHIPFMRGRGLVARFSQYAGFRPKSTAKGKGKAAADDNDDDEDDDGKEKARKEGAPANGDDGDTGDQEELASEDDDEKMEDDEDDEKMSDDVDSDDDEDKTKNKKGKKAKGKGKAAADDGDDEKCEDDADEKKAARRRLRAAAFKEGQRAQRSRWSKVLSSSHAANNLDTALRLLSSTSLHSRDVIAELKKVGASTTSRDRRDGNPRIDTRGRDVADVPPDQRNTAAIQSSWAKAFAPTIKATN